MRKELHKILICPFDHSELSLQTFVFEGEEIIEGLMTCSKCNRYYPIIKGIPIMSPDEYREKKYEAPLLEEWSDKIEGLPTGDFKMIDKE